MLTPASSTSINPNPAPAPALPDRRLAQLVAPAFASAAAAVALVAASVALVTHLIGLRCATSSRESVMKLHPAFSAQIRWGVRHGESPRRPVKQLRR
jgi:hypothetical protein